MNLVEGLRKSINELMDKNNISRRDFANSLGYSVTDVDRILYGDVLIPPVEIERIANLFGMTMDELIHYQDRESKFEIKEILSIIEIEEILVKHFNAFDADLEIVNIINEEGERDHNIIAKIIDFKE